MAQNLDREIIYAKKDDSGRIVVTLYSQEFEFLNSDFKNGVALLNAFGKVYEIRVEMASKKKRVSKKKESPITMGEIIELIEENPMRSI